MSNNNCTAAQPLDLDKLEALARAATRGPWKRSNRPNGPFWHISSEYTIGGEPCKSGRQSIGAIHAENKRGAPKYAAMFEANANFVAEFNPATALALIAQARAAQPESATGTTGASIDTPEFRALVDALLNEYWNPEPHRAALINHIDAIIGDLCAQLAATTENLQTSVRKAWEANAELSKLRAQLAGKGQSAVRCVVCGSDEPRTGTCGSDDPRALCNRSAPASAQPADVCAEMRALCPNCGGTGEVHRADGEYLGACDCPASAQPDRGAAELDEQAIFGVLHDCMGGDIARARLRDASQKIAAALSPASQPVAPAESAYSDLTKIIFERYPRIKGAHCASIAYGIIEYLKNRDAAPSAVVSSDATNAGWLANESAVFAEMSRFAPNWRTNGTSLEGAVRTALQAIRNLAASQSPATSAADAKGKAAPPMPKRWQDRRDEYPKHEQPCADFLIEQEMKEWREWGANVARKLEPVKGKADAANAGGLRACPFCGNAADLVDHGTGSWRVACLQSKGGCGASGRMTFDKGITATAEWNRRVSQSPATSAADAKDAARWRMFIDILIESGNASDATHAEKLLDKVISCDKAGKEVALKAINAAMAAAPSSEKGGA